MIYGHHAQTKAELAELVDKGEWDKLLRFVPLKPSFLIRTKWNHSHDRQGHHGFRDTAEQ